jgi:hypothetical protein
MRPTLWSKLFEQTGVGGQAGITGHRCFGLVLCQQFGRCRQRDVDGAVRDLHQERAVLVGLDEADGVLGEELRGAPLLRIAASLWRHDVSAGLDHRLPSLVLGAEAGAAEVPLAEVTRSIPGRLQPFGKRLDLQRQVRRDDRIDQFRKRPAMSRDVLRDPEPSLILPRLQIGPCRRTDRPGIELGETHSLASQPIDIRRLVERVPVAAQVRPAQIVGQNADDVGPPGSERILDRAFTDQDGGLLLDTRTDSHLRRPGP